LVALALDVLPAAFLASGSGSGSVVAFDLALRLVPAMVARTTWNENRARAV
jgi:hypothetical protein